MAAGRPNKKAVAVRKLLEKDPTMTAVKIAEKVGCHPFYVGKVKRDMGLTKPRKKKRVSTQPATLVSARKPKKKALPKDSIDPSSTVKAGEDQAEETGADGTAAIGAKAGKDLKTGNADTALPSDKKRSTL